MRSLRDNIDKCPILPPQQDMVEVLYNIRISTSFRYRALRSFGQKIGSNNIVVFLTIQYYCLSLRHE